MQGKIFHPGLCGENEKEHSLYQGTNKSVNAIQVVSISAALSEGRRTETFCLSSHPFLEEIHN